MSVALRFPPDAPSRLADPYAPVDWRVKLLFRFVSDTGRPPEMEPAQIEELARQLNRGDPLADAVVALYGELPPGQGRKLLDQALEQGIDSIEEPPEALKALFAQLDNVPIWVDRDKLDMGCRVMRRTGIFAELVLRNVALMGGYLSAAAIKPLLFTGQLDRMAFRRLIETGKFWVDVTTENGLQRHNEGFKSAVRVRLMHAMVRGMLLKSGRWNHQDWGHPINQSDLLATNLLFSEVFLTSLRALGFHFSRPEREAVIHLWRYIGYLLGVDEHILPACEADAVRATWLQYRTIPGPDADTGKLGNALTQVPYGNYGEKLNLLTKFLADIEVHYRSGFSRLIFGKASGDALGLPDSAVKYAVLATVPAIYTLDTMRRYLPFGTQLAVRVGKFIHEDLLSVGQQSTGADTTFTPVKTLVR